MTRGKEMKQKNARRQRVERMQQEKGAKQQRHMLKKERERESNKLMEKWIF